MTRLSVVTPSLARDFELCEALNRSVLLNSPDSVEHHIVVPRTDVERFARLASPRTRIRCELEFLPRSFVRLPVHNVTVNLRCPFPPVRGWILQQVVKLAVVAASRDDVVLLVDSDIEFLRPFDAEAFVNDRVVRFYRRPDAVHARLPRHVRWHATARSLLGLPPAPPPYPDYVSSLLAWDPAIVRRMLERVSATTGRPWPTAIAAQLHFSEWTLYGVFVDHLLGPAARSFTSDDPLCLTYWDEVPLSETHAAALVSSLRPTHVAAMISTKSETPLPVRRAAYAALRAARPALEDGGRT